MRAIRTNAPISFATARRGKENPKGVERDPIAEEAEP
jgi:hypothetical protein